MDLNKIPANWQLTLGNEFDKPYFREILKKIEVDLSEGKIIFPPIEIVFNSLVLTPFHSIKVVIIGQDPYHGEVEANGLSFSVNEGIKIPPSLRNIFKELSSDINGFEIPNHGNLEKWAKQGVLLLNNSLTVIKDLPNSHSKIGWEQFTNKIIENISNQNQHVVFILWGKNAQEKIQFINPNKHLVIKSVHPSPLSASRGFFGSKPFSKTNEYLIKNNKTPIDWQL
jgi:uracil-DNA glycosylase